MKEVVILGAGGHAHVIRDIIEAEGNKVVAFLDDDLSQEDCTGPISDYTEYSGCEFVIGIGNANVREKLAKLQLKWHAAVHPSAIISPSVTIEEGTVVMPLAVINARTRVGKHCIINTGAIVEHDNVIGDYSHVSVNASLGGTVKLGEKVWVGIGASVKNNVDICDDVFIGAGTAVIENINEEGTYVGLPAKKMQ